MSACYMRRCTSCLKRGWWLVAHSESQIYFIFLLTKEICCQHIIYQLNKNTSFLDKLVQKGITDLKHVIRLHRSYLFYQSILAEINKILKNLTKNYNFYKALFCEKYLNMDQGLQSIDTGQKFPNQSFPIKLAH